MNHFPENQSVFSKKRTVPGENSDKEAVKSKMNIQNIKIFSGSIAKSIRARQFTHSIKTGNTRIHSFLGATSKQLLDYLDVDFESTADIVILHIVINYLL